MESNLSKKDRSRIRSKRILIFLYSFMLYLSIFGLFNPSLDITYNVIRGIIAIIGIIVELKNIQDIKIGNEQIKYDLSKLNSKINSEKFTVILFLLMCCMSIYQMIESTAYVELNFILLIVGIIGILITMKNLNDTERRKNP